MTENKKQLPSADFALSLSASSGLPAVRIPDVKPPSRGREGERLAREMREKYFRLWHNMVLARLGIESGLVLNDYAQEMLDAGINRMLDRHLNTHRLPAANGISWEITEMCIKNLVAMVRAILENYPRTLGEIISW